MTSATAEARGPVAPWRHTWILCGILTAIALAGYYGSRRPGAASPSVAGAGIYAMLIFAELALLWAVRLGLRQGGTRLIDIVTRRPLNARAIATDLVLGAALLGIWLLIGEVIDSLSAADTPPLVQRLVVHDPATIPLWVALSLAAGFVEELTFRGYLQRQFASRLGIALAIPAQAILFGVSHGYQGVGSMLVITLFGIVFGLMAWARGSLIPGTAAHATVDLLGGLQLFR